MSEITDYRIIGLKTSIHSLRLRIGLLWSYLNKKNQTNPENYYKEKDSHKTKFRKDLTKKNNDQEVLSEYKNYIDNDPSFSNKSQKINLHDKRTISSNADNGLITLLPGECAINQGEKGDSAFLIISGSFNVEIDDKVIGGMSSGEIFGELSLILAEKKLREDLREKFTQQEQIKIEEKKIIAEELKRKQELERKKIELKKQKIAEQQKLKEERIERKLLAKKQEEERKLTEKRRIIEEKKLREQIKKEQKEKKKQLKLEKLAEQTRLKEERERRKQLEKRLIEQKRIEEKRMLSKKRQKEEEEKREDLAQKKNQKLKKSKELDEKNTVQNELFKKITKKQVDERTLESEKKESNHRS